MSKQRSNTRAGVAGHSLLPLVEAEEQRVAAALAAAREEADRRVSEAERAAAERLAAHQAELPAKLEAELECRLAELKAEAGQTLTGVEGETAELARLAEANYACAAAHVLAAVWPGGAS